jgi:hypothetical protein
MIVRSLKAHLLVALTLSPGITLVPCASAQIRTFEEERRGTSVPFDDSVEKLPPFFAGTNITPVRDGFGARANMVKDEFETRAQYEERVRSATTKPVYGSIMPDSVLASVNEFRAAYDADGELMTIEASYLAGLRRLALKSKRGGFSWRK